MAHLEDSIPLALRVERELMKEIRAARKRASDRSGVDVTISATVRKLIRDGLKKDRRAK